MIWLSVNKHGVADRAIHEHGSGWLIRIGEVLNGPLALVLRFFGLIPFAAISFLIGALVSRFGWIAVGKVSGADPEACSPRNATSDEAKIARLSFLAHLAQKRDMQSSLKWAVQNAAIAQWRQVGEGEKL